MAEPIQGVPEGLKEEALPAVQGVPEGLTEEALPNTTTEAVKPTKEKQPGWIETANKAYEGEPAKPMALTPEYGANVLRRLGSSVGRTLMAPVNMAQSGYKAITEPSTVEEAGLTAPQRLAKRMLYDPSAQAIEQEKQHEATDAAAGMPHSTAEKVLNRAVSAVPMVGPFVESEGQRAGKGDIVGAAGDIAGMEALGRLGGKAVEEPLPALKKAAYAPIRGLSKAADVVVPAAPYAAGAAVGHPLVGARVFKGITEPLSDIVEAGKVAGLSPEEATHQQLEERAVKSEKEAEKTQKAVDRYKASAEQGVQPPEDVVRANDKAQHAASEDRFHADAAREAMEKAKAARPEPTEVPTEKVTAQPPIEGVPADLTEEPIPTPEAKPSPTPEAPVPVAKGYPEVERRAPTPEMDYTGAERRNAVKDTEGVNATIARDVNMPKSPAEEAKTKAAALPEEEPTGYAAKKEEIVPAGAEGRTPAKSAEEYHPAVEQKVNELSDENLRKLAKAHGLNPDEYDFNARDERRHRVERDQLSKDITAQLGEDEKINLGRAAEATEKQGTFAGADVSAKGRAARAEKMFPRLRGPVDQFGNPKVSGGAPETVGTKEAADKDTEHFANAKKELGANASISDVAKRAQELKDVHAQVDAHDENGGSTFSSKGKNLNGTNKYSVGYYPDRTEHIDNLTSERLEEFKNNNADLLSKEDHAVGTWKDPDTGKAVLDVTKLYTDRDAAIAAGKDANQKSIYHLGGEGEIETGGTGKPEPSAANAKLSDEELKAKGFTQEDIDAGEHLPPVSGGAPSALPTGDALIKKYGESSGDPKDLTFILKDGRGVANTGIEHDHMLGGRTNEKVPPRERFIAEGNIRVRPHMGTGGREVSISIPESGVNAEQLKYIQKMSPQLRSGAVAIEVGKPGGAYKIIPYGEATNEALEKAVTDLAPKPQSVGAARAGTALAKESPLTPKQLQERLPDLAQKHLTPEEKESLTTTATGKPSGARTAKFVEQLTNAPALHEWVDAAKGGEGAKHWYQRSGKAFDALHEEAPQYFQDGDREKWGNFVAALSPQQMVHNNLHEALHAWTQWVEDGRPMDDKAMEKSLRDSIKSVPTAKVPNAMLALKGEDMWPTLDKNQYFKVPSFGKNLNQYLNFVTNDGWQALFGGMDPKSVSKPETYHPLSVMTRAAAKELGWEPAEAQAAIWSFTQALKEQGEVDPHVVRQYSEDFADIMTHNKEIRNQLKSLGVDLGQLDTKLKAIGEKPEVTAGASASTEHSTRQLADRIETARGKGTVPPPKSAQGELGFREPPATEGRARVPDEEDTSFNPDKFRTQTDEPLTKLGKKKSPFGNLR